MKKQRRYIASVSVLFLVGVVCAGCDGLLGTTNIEGTWRRSYDLTYDDGTESAQEEIYTFTCDKGTKQSGTFSEVTVAEDEYEDDDVSCSYIWKSTIRGEWEIVDGDLYTTYDLYTLEVDIDKDDIDIDFDSGNDLYDDFAYLMVAVADKEIYQKLKKETYQTLYDYYEDCNRQDADGCAFLDVKVEGDVLSFTTGDGLLEYERVTSFPK